MESVNETEHPEGPAEAGAPWLVTVRYHVTAPTREEAASRAFAWLLAVDAATVIPELSVEPVQPLAPDRLADEEAIRAEDYPALAEVWGSREDEIVYDDAPAAWRTFAALPPKEWPTPLTQERLYERGYIDGALAELAKREGRASISAPPTDEIAMRDAAYMDGWRAGRDRFSAFLQPLLEALLAHIEELEEAWRTSALSEHDGHGGARSNRNVWLARALRHHLGGTPFPLDPLLYLNLRGDGTVGLDVAGSLPAKED